MSTALKLLKRIFFAKIYNIQIKKSNCFIYDQFQIVLCVCIYSTQIHNMAPSVDTKTYISSI